MYQNHFLKFLHSRPHNDGKTVLTVFANYRMHSVAFSPQANYTAREAAKLMSTFADGRVSRGQRYGSARPLI
jgi:hypothetical protein